MYDSQFIYSSDHEEVKYLITESSSPDASDVIDALLMTKEQVESYTMSSEEFITSCTFDDITCNPSDLKEWTSDKYGKCYTFNSFFGDAKIKGKTERNVKKARTAGPKSGLKLTLNIKAAYALSLFSAERGVKVIIHSPKTIPFPEEEGFNVQPDASTNIQLKVKKYKRVTPPHGKCRNKRIDSKYSYTQMLCKKICLEKYIQEECQCKLGMSPAYDQFPNNTNLTSCSGDKVKDNFCLGIAQFKFTHRLLDCDCPIKCDEDEYDVMTSSSHADINYFKIIQNIKKENAGDYDCSWSTNSTVRFRVYLQNLKYELIKESPSYSFDTLISNLGGNLGLFVGMSIVSMVELVVFIIDLTSQSLKRKEKVQQQKNQENRGKWTPVYVISQSAFKDMMESQNKVKTAWSEEKKEKARNYFSKIFYDEE
ncbi:UNVERIFIED_CONTAM: hypothetical protein RMT77_012656 [Armadillidium vulgare]